MMSIIEENDKKAATNNKRIHPVTGYSDTENMWQKLANIEKDVVPSMNKYPNKKSQFIVQVHDKIFRLKKNPAYTGKLDLPILPDMVPDPEGEPETASQGD